MHTGADFISLRGEESRTSKPRRGLTSSRGHYGPPKGPLRAWPVCVEVDVVVVFVDDVVVSLIVS